MVERVDTATPEAELLAITRTAGWGRALELLGTRLGEAGAAPERDLPASGNLAALVASAWDASDRRGGIAEPAPELIESLLAAYARDREICYQVLADLLAGGDPKEVQKGLGYPIRDTFYAHLRSCRDAYRDALAATGAPAATQTPAAPRGEKGSHDAAQCGDTERRAQVAAFEFGVLPERLRQEQAAHFLLCGFCFEDGAAMNAGIGALKRVSLARFAELKPAASPQAKQTLWERFFKSSYFGKD